MKYNTLNAYSPHVLRCDDEIRTAITLTINPHLFSTGGLTLSIELELDAALALLFVIGSHSSTANRILLDAALDHF
jgi:hypothetical protein